MNSSADPSAPIVSVTSAFYNTGPALLDMIESVRAQTFEDWELVLLDDGSTDNSLALARSVCDDRIRVVSNDRNLGRSASLNRLSKLARGRYVARMDSDDMSASTRLDIQVAYLDAHPDVDLVGTAVLYIGRDNEPIGWRAMPPDHEAICRHPSRMFNIVHGSILARREWFERFAYDEALRLSVDSNLFFRSYRQSRFANIVEPLYYYRFEPSYTLSKQWRARRTSASYLYNDHRRAGRPFHAVFYWVIQHAKFALTAIAFAFGLRRKLLARRFQPLSAAQKADYLADLKRIQTRRGSKLGDLRIVQLTTLGISAKAFLVEHFKRLREEGADVVLVCSDDPEGRTAADVAGIRHLPVTIKQYFAPLSDLVTLIKLCRLFRRLRPNVIHAHMTKAGLLGILVGWWVGVPVRIYHNHGLAIVSARGVRRWILLVSDWFTHRLATESLFCSESTRDAAIEAGVVRPERARVLGRGSISGVDVTKFNPCASEPTRAERRRAWGVSQDTVVVGYVGRLLVEKGIETLIEAWRRIDPSVRERARLVFIGGDARGEPRMRSVVAGAVSENIGVQTMGWTEDMAACYAGMDLLVLPSLREGFPYSILEAQSMGLPVVATRTTGTIDAVQHEVTGLLVEVQNPAALADALTRLICSSEQRKRIGDQARRRVLDVFTQDDVLHHMIAFYQERVAPLVRR